MKHLIIVKWNETVSDKKAMAEEVRGLFEKAMDECKIRSVEIIYNAVDLPNRSDCIFSLDIDRENLPIWVDCDSHIIWKRDYVKYVTSKAVFDLDQPLLP